MTVATRSRFVFDGIGTAWSIVTDEPLADGLRRKVLELVDDYDRLWSRFRADSVVSRLAARGGSAELGPTARPLLGLLIDLAGRTGGALNPLVGASLDHLGYDADYRLLAAPGYLPAPPASILTVRGGTVRLASPAVIDVGAAGKGQLVDLVTDLLRNAGHGSFLVDGGGDLRAGGGAVRVALEHPNDPSAAIGVVDLVDGALCASAVNRRSWTDIGDPGGGRVLHHVLDARTGRPVDRIQATWVLADDAMTADALATALFFVEPAALADVYAFRYVRMWADGRAEHSVDLPGELFR